MSAGIEESGPLFVRYQSDIWVEVAPDGEVLTVVVDSSTMEDPVDIVRADASPVDHTERAAAINAAQTGLWPSWDFGETPTSPGSVDV